MPETNPVSSKLIIAAAGSGKTTSIVREALTKPQTEKVLITTYTEANAESIKQKIIEVNRFIPPNIIVKTWFSFLLQHGVKPYQGDGSFPTKDMWKTQISGCVMPDGNSSIRRFGQRIISLSEARPEFYFSGSKIYTDKLAKFAIRCNVNNQVIDRIHAIFKHIFIDEIQDFAGYDLDFLELLIKSPINLVMVGDPRQATYSTSNVRVNSAYSGGKIENFVRAKRLSDHVIINTTSLNINYRCDAAICNFSNLLFPAPWPQTRSANKYTGEHVGIFLIKKSEVNTYLSKFVAVQLRWNKTENVNFGAATYNLGDAKGLEFDRVLIYPTGPFKQWLNNHATELKAVARARFYVGLTRAKYSVGIVCDDNIEGIPHWSLEE